MRKLQLSLDDLQVDSFHPTAPQPARGTVQAHSEISFPETCKVWCSADTGCATCDVSCNGTCYNSCGASCAGTCGSCACSAYNTECGCQTWETCPGEMNCA